MDATALRDALPTLPSAIPASLLERLARHRFASDPDLAWRRILGRHTSPLDLLQDHARRLLRPHGAYARLVADPDDPGNEILRWRAVSLLLPAAPLLGALAAPVAPGRVRVLDPTLRPAGRFAYLHLHAGAAFRFEDAWLAAMQDPHRCPPLPAFSPEASRALMLAAGAVHAALEVHDGHGGPLPACTACDVAEALAALARADPAPRPYDRLPAVVAARRRQRDGGAPLWEAERVRRGLAWLRADEDSFARPASGGAGGPDAELALLQYLRVQGLLFRAVTLDPTTRGLAAFRPAAAVARRWRPPVGAIAAHLAAESADLDLGAAEVRVVPDPKAGWARNLVDRRPALPGAEVALVASFLRSPRDDAPLITAFQAQRKTSAALVRALGADPRVLEHLRGLDLCSDERPGPLWLAAGALVAVRDASREAAACAPPLEPLRLTLHVGEDFYHLLSGLRAVHEPFLIGLLERGDRLGHARALGLEPGAWCAAHPKVDVPRWVRLLDLAWALRQADTWRLDVTPADRAAIVRELTGLGDGDGRLGDELLTLVTTPGRVDRLLPAFTPATPAERLLLELCHAAPSRGAASPWQDPVEVRTAPEAPLLRALSRRLAEHLAGWQVAIEVNPTSNLLVGGQAEILDQPVFGVPEGDPRAIPLVVSSDDPVTFATGPADELAYAWAGLVAGGNTPGRARAWIDECTAHAWRLRFSTAPLSRGPDTARGT